MAIALVKQGTLFSLTQSAGGSGTISPTFGQATAAGNLLIAVIWQGGVTGTSVVSGTGWVEVGSGPGCHLFYKKNCGASETAPVFSSNGGTYGAAQLLEFSGADTNAPLDKFVATTTGGTSPLVGSMGANDTNATDLAVIVWTLTGSKTQTLTTSDAWTPAGGTKVATVTDSATKQIPHGYASCYVNTAGGSANDVDTLTFTPSTGVVSNSAYVIGSFKVSSPAVAGSASLSAATSLTAAGTSTFVAPLSATTSLTAAASVNERATATLPMATSLVTAGITTPTPPTNIYVVGVVNSTTSLTVSWDSQGTGVTYDVDRSTDQSTWTNVATATSATSITDTARTADTIYYYRVRATNAVGTGAYGLGSGRTGKSVTLATPVNLGTQRFSYNSPVTFTLQAGARVPTGGSVVLMVGLESNDLVNQSGLFGAESGQVLSASDSQGNQYIVAAVSAAQGTSGGQYALVYCPVVANTLLAGDTITVNFYDPYNGGSNRGVGTMVGVGFNGNMGNVHTNAEAQAATESVTTNTVTVTGGIEGIAFARYWWQTTSINAPPASSAGFTKAVDDQYINSGSGGTTYARIDYETGYGGTAVTDSLAWADSGFYNGTAYFTIFPVGATPMDIIEPGNNSIGVQLTTTLGTQTVGTSTTTYADTFNRANQAGLGTASDGGTWTVDTPDAASISTNTAILTTGDGHTLQAAGSAESIVRRDLGAQSVDVTFTIAPTTLSGASYRKFYVAYNPTDYSGVIIWHTGGASTGSTVGAQLKASATQSLVPSTNVGMVAPSIIDNASHTLRVQWDNERRHVKVWWDGTLELDFGYDLNPFVNGYGNGNTWCGWSSQVANSVDGLALDNFTGNPLLPGYFTTAPPINASLAAVTALTAASVVTEFGGATLLAATTQLAAGTIVIDAGTASLVATTTFATSASVTVQATASLAATTSLTIAAFVQEFAGSGLSAVTTLSAAASVTEFAASSLTASTSLTAPAFVQELGAAGLTAVTTLVVSGTRVVPGTASLTAATTLTTAGSVTELASASLTAVTSLSASAFAQELGISALSAQTSLTAAGATQELAVAALTAVATLTAAARVTELASATLPASTSLTVTAFLQIGTGAASLTAATSLSAAGVTREQGVAALTAVTSLSATATTQAGASAGLTLGTALTSAGFTQELAQATLTASTSLTTTGVRGVPGSATLVAATSLTAAGLVTELAASALTATTSLAASGVVSRLGVAALTAATTLTASGSVTETAAATLVAATGLGVSAVDTVFALAALSASTSLSAAGSVTELAVAALTAATSLSASASVTEQAAASLSATTALSASALVVEQAVAALTAATVLTVAAAVMGQAAAGLTMDTTLAADGSVTTISGAVTLQMLTTLSVVAHVFGALRDIEVLLGDRYDPITLGEQALAIAFDLVYDHISTGLPMLPVALFGEVDDVVALGERQEVAAVGSPYDPITLGDPGL